MLRQKNGWSLDKTSKHTGVSKAMLGQIERGESSPTISTLWKIASGFKASFSAFIDEPHSVQNTLVHRSRSPDHLHPQDDKIRISPLFPFEQDLSFEVFLIELLPGCEHLSPSHDGNVVEHAIVIEGEIEVLVDGAWHKLKKNEGLRFNANQPHGYRNTTEHLAVFHDAIHYRYGP
jgi:transcriptional regulator with XRE-family HTH domain